MRKVMISVAPVDAGDVLNNPRAIARDVIDCYHAGASMVHLHCRDLNGQLTPDVSLLAETVAYITEAVPIVVEISTGGVSNLTIQERCMTCYPDWVECNSLNVGSVNLGTAVYRNPIEEVHFCCEQIKKYNKIPEIEVFEAGMINTVRELNERWDFIKPILFAIVLGHGGAMPATVQALNTMLQALRDNFPNEGDVLWGFTEAHRTGWDLVKVALDKGASAVRIGFEDSHYLDTGVLTDSNAPMIAKVSDIVKSKGMMPMTPDEVRAMLKIPPRARR